MDEEKVKDLIDERIEQKIEEKIEEESDGGSDSGLDQLIDQRLSEKFQEVEDNPGDGSILEGKISRRSFLKTLGLGAGGLTLSSMVSGANLLSGTTIGGNTAWHAGNDGSGSGLDADTVDGKDASSLGGGSAGWKKKKIASFQTYNYISSKSDTYTVGATSPNTTDKQKRYLRAFATCTSATLATSIDWTLYVIRDTTTVMKSSFRIYGSTKTINTVTSAKMTSSEQFYAKLHEGGGDTQGGDFGFTLSLYY